MTQNLEDLIEKNNFDRLQKKIPTETRINLKILSRTRMLDPVVEIEN